MPTNPASRRIDSEGRDVTDLPGLWDEGDTIVSEPVSEAVRVHREIMNLPAKYEGAGTAEGKYAYVVGFKDARHAAAELAQSAVAKVEAERDAWKREWRSTLDRISGATNEIAARETAQYILQTLQRWRDGRKPAPLIVDPQLDAESFVVIIKNAISSRTDELQSQLSTLTADLATKDGEIAELRKSVADYSQHLGDIVTYGTSAESLDKALQEWVPRAKEAEAQLTALRTACEAAKAKLQEIICTEGLDAGVLYKSTDLPTHRDPTTGKTTYDHEYFSSMGDSLIELNEILTTALKGTP